MNIGIGEAKHDLIARMDADDIALPQRLEWQFAEFVNYKELDVLGGQIDEFSGEMTNVIGRRIVPEDHNSIAQFAKRRSPFNHPTVMYKRKAVLAVGGYRESLRSEDYDLWVRMLKHGYRAKNLRKTVLMFRVNNAGVDRRKNWRTVRDQIEARKLLYREGYIGLWDLAVASGAYVIMALSPTAIAALLYKGVLRKRTYYKND